MACGALVLFMRSVYGLGVNILVQQLKQAIADLARAKGLSGARVLEKVNLYGEVVIALILPARGSASAPREPGPED